MRRFFVQEIDADSTRAEIGGDEFHHLKDVLRLAPGAEVALFNGKGVELAGIVETVGKGSAVVKVSGRKECPSESPVAITLLQGFIKGDRPELIVQKATELGVREILFYTAPRTVPKLAGERLEKRLLRLKRVALEAVKQCGRGVVPVVGIKGFQEAVTGAAGGLKVMLHNKGKVNDIKEVLGGYKGGGVILLVGPEGGLTEDEAAGAVEVGFIPACFGPRTLRAETAAIAALSVVQYELGDMGQRR
ncbi:MAG: 16S rRNA (uracil(1498)-N(3))-methyltransferase [Thermodesulfobacteriota bacterium]